MERLLLSHLKGRGLRLSVNADRYVALLLVPIYAQSALRHAPRARCTPRPHQPCTPFQLPTSTVALPHRRVPEDARWRRGCAVHAPSYPRQSQVVVSNFAKFSCTREHGGARVPLLAQHISVPVRGSLEEALLCRIAVLLALHCLHCLHVRSDDHIGLLAAQIARRTIVGRFTQEICKSGVG